MNDSFCPQPSWFRPAGKVTAARFDERGSGFGPRRASGRRGEGLRYEHKALQRLDTLYPGMLVWGPWLRFSSAGRPYERWCQPDGLLIDVNAGVIVVVEVKHHHTAEAWWQLERLYKPVLRHLFPEQLWRIELLEVVRWFDPAVLFPCPVVLVERPTVIPLGKFGVHIIGRRDC